MEDRRGREELSKTYGSEGAHSIKAHIEVCETIRGLRGEVFERKEGLLRSSASLDAVDELGRASDALR